MAPRQLKIVEVSISSVDGHKDSTDIVTPTETMANVLCDFQEILWSGSTLSVITLNNLGDTSIALTQGQQVGSVEPAEIVSRNDPVFSDIETQVLLCHAKNETEQIQELTL